MKRSILGLLYLIQGMRHVGINVDERLAAVGIQAQALDPGSIIQPELERTIQRIIAHDVQPELGLQVGQHYALAGYGPLLMLLVTSPTVEQALQYGIQYQALTHLSGQLSLEQDQHYAALCYVPSQLEDDVDLFRAQCEISGTMKFVQDIYKMIGLEFPQVQVDLPFCVPEQPVILQLYQRYFSEQLRFGQEQFRLVFDPQILSLKLPSADLITFRVHQQRCQAEMQRLQADIPEQSSVVQSVYDYLDLQKGHMPTMAETAQALNIPERTLRHQLNQQNTSYKKIREELIRNKALRLIEYKEYSIEVIAEMLGYSEPAAFNHAFKRWFGQSPRQYGK